MLHMADARATDISGILAFLGFPITANRMPKRALARGLNAVKGNQNCVCGGGVWALFPFVERKCKWGVEG